jgi:hypothetical protein
MGSMRPLVILVALFALPVHAQEAPGKKSSTRRALNHVFKGEIVSIKGRRVTIRYDFEDAAQLNDFEEARPPRLLDASRNRVRIERGRLVLEGSTGIRHKLESAGRIRAEFTVRVDKKRNVGAVITEPILSDFYVVYNLFDYRFNRNGYMHIGACGLHEDEGAEDLSTGLVNFRDIFARDVRRKVDVDKPVEVEVSKDGWKEFFRVGKVKGKGSSKGKTKEMKACKFGFFVHGSKASFDDLVLTCELSKEYLEYENLRLAVDPNPPVPKAKTKSGHK